MAKHSTDFILGSLKGKIWLAVSILAVLNCLCGLFAYLTASFLFSDPFFSVFITFGLSAFTTMVFGWWLCNEVLNPIEKVSLLAKSLERSPAASLPRTTGSSETDELLKTLSRNSQQIQHLIGMMDSAAAGKTDLSFSPIQNSDRLTTSFQKLVSKVSESINAKSDLEALQSGLYRLSKDISPITSGNLTVPAFADFAETKPVTDTIKFLLGRLNVLVNEVRTGSAEALAASSDARKALRASIENENAVAGKLRRTVSSIRNESSTPQRAADELLSVIGSAAAAMEHFELSANSLSVNAGALKTLRTNLNDAVRKTQKMKDLSSSMMQIAKSAEELSKRSNLISLNASLETSGIAESKQGRSLLGDEIGVISKRADGIRKEISSLGETVGREIAEIESTLRLTTGEIAGISDREVESGESMAEMEKHLCRLAELQPKFEVFRGGQATGNARLMELSAQLDSVSGDTDVRESEELAGRICHLMQGLHESVSDLVSFENPVETIRAATGEKVGEDRAVLAGNIPAVPEFELAGEN